MKTLLGLAAACLVAFVALVSYQPHIDYGEFETSCRSAAFGGGNGFLLGVDGGGIKTDVVRGEDEVDELENQAGEAGVVDPFFTQRQLDADCSDKRSQVLVRAQVATLGFAACLAGAVLLGVRRRPTSLGA